MPYDEYPSLDELMYGDSVGSKPRWPTRRGYQGPASDLPSTAVDVGPLRLASSDAWSGIDSGFSREFDFSDTGASEPIKGYDPSQALTVGQRSKQFIDQYFGGQESPVTNPVTGKFYGDELRLHDAFHQYANLGNTLRGEEQVTVGEKAGNTRLLGDRLQELTQQPTIRARVAHDVLDDPFELSSRGAQYATGGGMRRGNTLVQQRGQSRGSSLFKDRNAVSSFLSPPIGQKEAQELIRRGQEFYDQVGTKWNQYLQGRLDRPAEGFAPDPATIHDLRNDFLSDARNMVIEGGYGGEGKLPYGDKRQFMNAPLVPTVRSDDYQRAIDQRLAPVVSALRDEIEQEKKFFNTPRNQPIRDYARWSEDSLLLDIAKGYRKMAKDTGVQSTYELPQRLKGAADTYFKLLDQDMQPYDAMIRALGLQPSLPAGQSYRDLFPATYGVLGYRANGVGPEEAFLKAPALAGTAIEGHLTDNYQRLNAGGVTGGVVPRDGIAYLNPANLGANKNALWADQGLDRFLDDPSDVLLSAAVDAKNLGRVRNAIATGVRATGDLVGLVPLTDPEFRQAVEAGDARKAGTKLAQEYATGLVTAPVLGMGAGALQRMAPATAAQVLPAVATGARIGNPVALASQLGGSAKPSQRQRAEEKRLDPGAFGAQGPSANPQLLRAEAARRRGGKWKLGPFTVPELGLSEAGGLFFR